MSFFPLFFFNFFRIFFNSSWIACQRRLTTWCNFGKSSDAKKKSCWQRGDKRCPPWKRKCRRIFLGACQNQERFIPDKIEWCKISRKATLKLIPPWKRKCPGIFLGAPATTSLSASPKCPGRNRVPEVQKWERKPHKSKLYKPLPCLSPFYLARCHGRPGCSSVGGCQSCLEFWIWYLSLSCLHTILRLKYFWGCV